MSNVYVIYHANCADGFTAAWAAWRNYPEWHYVAGLHDTLHEFMPPPGSVLYFVDIAPKREHLLALAQVCEGITILDHHKSAAEQLAGVEAELKATGGARVDIFFDMEKSGAMLAWEHFNPGLPAPPLVEHVQDRDLWRFAIPGTREFQITLFSYEYDFDTWDTLASIKPDSLIAEGHALNRKHMKDVRELIRIGARDEMVAGVLVPVLNCPYFHSSEAGNLMSEGRAFAACYYDAYGRRNFSLRSKDGGADVSAIAKQFGGGGHARAAGFSVPMGEWPTYAPGDGA